MTKATVFMCASWTGLAGVAAVVAAPFMPESYGIAALGAVVVFWSSVALLSTRKADEYTIGLWNEGASFAFASLLVLLIALPFGEGLLDGLMGAEAKLDLGPEHGALIAFGAFYIGLFWKRMKGGT